MGVDINTYLFYGIHLKNYELSHIYDRLEDRLGGDEDTAVFEFLEENIDGWEEAKFLLLESNSGGDAFIGAEIKCLGERDDDVHIISPEDLPDPFKLVTDINEKLGTAFSRNQCRLYFFNYFF